MGARTRTVATVTAVSLLLVACGSDGDFPTRTPTIGDSSTTKPTTTVSPDKVAAASEVGDVAAGLALFNEEMEGVPHDLACSSCHSLDGVDGRSPSLAGISDSSATNAVGLSAVEYLRQSILAPAIVREGDWPAVMPVIYAELLTDEEVDNLIAFMLTQ